MAYYYNINNFDDSVSSYKGFHLQKFNKSKDSTPTKMFDFSRYVLVELLDNSTPETKLWKELGLANNKNIIHKRMMIDSHRINCRRAIVVCTDVNKAKKLAERLSQTKIMKRCICAVVIEELLSDLHLFERQVLWFGDKRSQHQLLYVSDVNKYQKPSELVQFLKEKFSPFGTILSIFTSTSDERYACREGIIKFAYLSEAFAAELAFDQYVVGKEQLSVTTHHNVLLSQCDLRLRLRNAQCINFSETNMFPESHPYSCDLQRYSIHNNLLNSLDNRQISCEENNTENNFGNISDANLKHKQSGSKVNVQLIKCETKSDCFTNLATSDSISFDKKNDSLASISKNKVSCSPKTIKTIPALNNTLQNNLDLVDNKRPTHFSEKLSVPNKLAKCIKLENSFSERQSNSKNESSPVMLKKSKVNKVRRSKYNRYNTSNDGEHHYSGFDSSSNETVVHSTEYSLPSSTMTQKTDSNKTVLSNAECSFQDNNTLIQDMSSKSVPSNSECSFQKDNTMTRNQSIFVDSKRFSTLLDSESTLSIHIKNTNKRKKRFISSQKLCLKSQRTASSQTDPNSSVKLSNFNVESSEQKQISKSNYVNKSIIFGECLHSIPTDPWRPSKVHEWLSQLPKPKTELHRNSKYSKKLDINSACKESHVNCFHTTPSLAQESILENRCLYLEKSNTKNNKDEFNSVEKEDSCISSQLDRRISLHTTPFLRGQNILNQKKNRLRLAKSDMENEDHNKSTVILSPKNCSITLDDSESPLKIWLKQELLFTINNTVTTCEDMSKSIIVCATKTKDIAISVGCSHMTCDSCYPDSTNLLLGYG